MQISRLRVQDFKKVKLVDVAIDGNVVTIGGDNAQGKSSLLDAIWNALAGKQKAVERPIRDGQKRASIEVTIDAEDGGGYVVTRSYTPSGSTITVVPKDNPGAKLSSPQKVLDQLIGKFAFDPLAFAMQDGKGQLKTLLDLVELDFDLPALEAERKRAYEERTYVGRERKSAEGALQTMGPRPDAGEAKSVTALAEELEARQRAESRRGELLGLHTETRVRIGVVEKKIAELQAELEREKARLQQIQDLGKEAATHLEGLRTQAEIRADMEAAEENNYAVAKRDEWDAAAERARAKEREYEALTDKIRNLDAQKAEGLARANFPIDGLSFDEEGVLYQGVPFAQASAAEKIRVSVAMAMAMNPELKVICVKDATLLDEKNRQVLIDLANEKGYQVFLEMVGASDEWTLVLEDGEVA